jgi:hypothetical protein
MPDLPMQDFQPRFAQPRMSLCCAPDAVHQAQCEFLLDGGLIVSHPRPVVTGDITIVNCEVIVKREGAHGNAAVEFIPRTSGTIAQELKILSPKGVEMAIIWEMEVFCTSPGDKP